MNCGRYFQKRNGTSAGQIRARKFEFFSSNHEDTLKSS